MPGPLNVEKKSLTKSVVVDSSTYVCFNMTYHNGMNFTKKKKKFLDFETTMNLFKNLPPSLNFISD